ncbi:MAG: S16 family serine protease [Candidatus Hadarchaeales archaeon]
MRRSYRRRKRAIKMTRGFTATALTAGIVISFLAGFLSASLLYRTGTMHAGGGTVWAAENTFTASVRIAAVKSEGGGIITTLEAEVGPGNGRVLTDTHPLVGFDFQYADRTAVKVASRITGYALDDDGEGLKGADIIYTVRAQGTIYIEAIDGPSAGAATTVATIAAIQGRKVREDVVITGTINEDGSIGAVGGILDKATAASESGASLFLVPEGQSRVTVYREVVKQVGPWRWVTYEPVLLDLNEYAENAGWSMRIQEVSTIEEAINLMIED